MKRCVAAIKFGLFASMTITCVAQESSWRTEHYDSLLVAPDATAVKYVDSSDGLHELTYIVEVPYPAANMVNFICEDMRRKGWGEPVTAAGDGWMETYIPGKSHLPYHWRVTWGRKKNEQVTYTLDYLEDDSSSYLRTLHVRAVYNSQVFDVDEHLRQIHAEVLKNRAQKEFEWPEELTYLLSLLLFGPPLIVACTEARKVVFYRGPNAWLTQINLCLFSTILTPVLVIAATLISIPFGEKSVLITGLRGWVIMTLLAKAGYVVCAVMPLLAVCILRIEKIPKNVKITHIALIVATFSFFVLCVHFYGGPSPHWQGLIRMKRP